VRKRMAPTLGAKKDARRGEATEDCESELFSVSSGHGRGEERRGRNVSLSTKLRKGGDSLRKRGDSERCKLLTVQRDGDHEKKNQY